MSHPDTDPVTPPAGKRHLVDQLPFQPRCLTVARRVGFLMILVDAACGCGLAAGVFYAHIRQPFIDGNTELWRACLHGVSAVVGGGLFGQHHATTGLFGWGSLLMTWFGYLAASAMLKRYRQPMLRDAVATPLLAGLFVGCVAAAVALVGHSASFGPSASRAFFIGFFLAWVAVAGAFLRRSGDYHTFFWRNVHGFVAGLRPALRAAAWFFGTGSVITLAVIVIGVLSGTYSVTWSTDSLISLAIAGANLLLALPLLWAGGTLTLTGSPFEPTNVVDHSIYSSFGAVYTIVLLVAGVVIIVIAAGAMAAETTGKLGVKALMTTLLTWFVIGAILLSLVSIRVKDAWALRVDGALGMVLLWALVTFLLARFVGPAILHVFPALKRHDDTPAAPPAAAGPVVDVSSPEEA
ncbi:MAG: hypothetical protein E7A62_04075 [Actinomycetaceae bacterium]|nr:hypothetical protein [Actinomycetaceae bacterium]MDU0970163.1 hypothetical protein [Actinomycetaceae bacterium]